MYITKPFPVKYKNTVYNDAHVGEDGHIWFNKDSLEFIPKHDLYQEDTVVQHSFVDRSGESIHVTSVTLASVIILKNKDKIYQLLNPTM